MMDGIEESRQWAGRELDNTGFVDAGDAGARWGGDHDRH
jgi:hypothetical protein